MIYVRLRNQLVELPTAMTLTEADGVVTLADNSGIIVARFATDDVLAWSFNQEKLRLGIESEGPAVSHAGGGRDGVSP